MNHSAKSQDCLKQSATNTAGLEPTVKVRGLLKYPSRLFADKERSNSKHYLSLVVMVCMMVVLGSLSISTMVSAKAQQPVTTVASAVNHTFVANRSHAATNLLATTITTTPLPIPTLLSGDLIDGVMVYSMTMRVGSTVLTGGLETETWGYNGDFLGPTLLMTKTDSISIHLTNQIGEDTTTHWHGFHLPAIMDGGPHQTIANGTTWRPYFTMLNRAALYWYHPHLHGKTGDHVWAGLAGMIIVNDAESDLLDLPKTYGVDDIPLVVQDRKFRPMNPPGTYEFDGNGMARGKGDTFLVNGAIAPTLTTLPQRIRFRILNGSNNRIYNFGLSDNREYQQIASDGGLLTSPVSRTRTLLSPGERVEIVIDFTNDANSSFTWKAYNSEIANIYVKNTAPDFDNYDQTDYDIFGIDVGSTASNPVGAVPTTLTTINRYITTDTVNPNDPRTFFLQGGGTINGLTMDMDRIDQIIQLGDLELWEIENDAGGQHAHPFHIHDDTFQVLTRDGVAPEAHEMGWKDTVLVKPGETVLVAKPFEDFADADKPFMFHCHLLTHEDNGMMGQFVIVDDFLVEDTASADSSQDGAAGSTVTYTQILTNPGSTNTYSFTIAVTSSENWAVVVSPASPITVKPRQGQVVTLQVTIPSDATTGTVDSLVMTATSSYNPDIVASSRNTTTVTTASTSIYNYLPIIVKN